jgi:hypothetical protein
MKKRNHSLAYGSRLAGCAAHFAEK